MAEQQETGSAVERTRESFETEDLRTINSWDDAVRLLKDEHVTVFDASLEIGDGFTMLEDKNALIGVPLIMMQWSWGESSFIDPATGQLSDNYLVARVITRDGQKRVIVDGGSGIAKQVRDFENRTGITRGLAVERGLRKSEYDNEFGHGVTFYLNV